MQAVHQAPEEEGELTPQQRDSQKKKEQSRGAELTHRE